MTVATAASMEHRAIAIRVRVTPTAKAAPAIWANAPVAVAADVIPHHMLITATVLTITNVKVYSAQQSAMYVPAILTKSNLVAIKDMHVTPA